MIIYCIIYFTIIYNYVYIVQNCAGLEVCRVGRVPSWTVPSWTVPTGNCADLTRHQLDHDIIFFFYID